MMDPAKQWKYLAAILLIGDGIVALASPQWVAEVWAVGPGWWKKSMRFLRDCPALTRLIASAEIAGGIWWTLSQENKTSESDNRASE